MTAFFRDRRSSWLACVAKAFPCGFGAKNEEGESKTARKIGRVIASKPHRNACYADYSWLNGDFREYQNHPFLGTWFRFSLQFFRSSHQDNFENFWQVVLPVQTLQIRYVDLFDGPRRLSIHSNCLECFTIIHYRLKLVYSSTIVFLLCFQ